MCVCCVCMHVYRVLQLLPALRIRARTGYNMLALHAALHAACIAHVYKSTLDGQVLLRIV